MRSLLRGGTIVRLPNGLHILVPDEFDRAASDRYRQAGPRFNHGSAELWREVTSSQGNVDFFTARQFIESHAKKLFIQNRHITDARVEQPLKNLGFETVINLYDAMTQRPMEDNSQYLDLLNQAIELDEGELKEWAKPVVDFFSSSNTDFLEKKWEHAKRSGKIAPSEGSFSQMMSESFSNPELITKGGYLRRKAILQFISDAYSDYVGEDRPKIELINGPEGLGGFHTVDERTGQHVIGINVNNYAFQSNFQSTMNVLNHERYHASDRMLGDRYRRGEITQSDPRYKRARIAAAAMNENGYISNDTLAGPLAYREQVIEVGAFFAGKLAEFHSNNTYAREPEPVISLRGDKERHLIGKEYEHMQMERARVHYPRGLSPFRGTRAEISALTHDLSPA